jgi:hypothetical protein
LSGKLLLSGLILTGLLLHTLPSPAQDAAPPADNTDYHGKIKTPPTSDKSGKPNTDIPDPFLSPLLKDGKTNVPLTPEAAAAQRMREIKQGAAGQFGDDTIERDRSVHLNVVSGSYVQVLITTDHAVQLSVLRNGEVVRPTNIILGSNEFVQYVYNGESSPYIYVSAKVALPGQTTDMFIETHEDGRVQTYVLKLICVEPSKVVFDVLLDLTNDNTPYIQGRRVPARLLKPRKKFTQHSSTSPARKAATLTASRRRGLLTTPPLPKAEHPAAASRPVNFPATIFANISLEWSKWPRLTMTPSSSKPTEVASFTPMPRFRKARSRKRNSSIH